MKQNDVQIISGKALIIDADSKSVTKPVNALAIRNGVIIDHGLKQDLIQKYGDQWVSDFPQSVIAPGFVNTHTHSVQTFFRGVADDFQLLDWLGQVILPGEATMTYDEVYASSMLGFMDMLSHGTTFSNDMLTVHHTDAGITAAKEIGIRVKIGKMLMDAGSGIPSRLLEETNDAVEESWRLIKRWHESTPLIEYSLNPRFLLSCSEKLVKEVASIVYADDKDREDYDPHGTLSLHTHANENQVETQLVKKMHGGMHYIEALKAYGALGERSIIAHGIWLEEQEVDYLAETKTAVAHNPSANCKLASGVCDWVILRERGVPIGVGTDGPPCNNTMDMFREIRLASFLQKVTKLNETVAPAREVFYLGTEGGARALRKQHVGALRPGMSADFLVIDISHPASWVTNNEYLSHLVFHASGESVKKTFVHGELVYDKDASSVYKMFPKLSESTMKKVLGIAEKYAEEKPWETRDPNA